MIAVATAIVFAGAPALAQKASPGLAPVHSVGVEIVTNGGEPELRVGGVPFFVHAARFDYFRIPQDLWAHSLLRYRDLGINTIDLRIPWNWHEPQDGNFDFDGHTNPNRDLRSLLALLARMNFKIIARPGPLIGDDWRNDGIPDWLLAHSEYGMSPTDVQFGFPPSGAQLSARDSDAAARGWLANDIHMSYARRWLTAIARELAPYSARNMISIPDPGDPAVETKGKQIPGPLLLVSLDDAVAVFPGEESAGLARYLAELRGALVNGGLDAISFLNVPGAAVQGLSPIPSASAPADSVPIGLSGQWIFSPRNLSAMAKSISANSPALSEKSLLTDADASSLSLLARTLAMQPAFPPMISAFSASTFAPAGDTQASQPAPQNTLLASRLLLGSGIRGMVYAPLQDTLTPAGWETPSAARYFRWDAPLDLAGNKGSRAEGVSRNGQFISVWGAMLAASHVQSDFGIVDLRASMKDVDRDATARAAEQMEQMCRVAALAGYAPDLVDPGTQSVERLLREPVILLRVPQEEGAHFQLSEKAQAALVEYVRGGGVLLYFPSRPQGSSLEQLWRGAPASPAGGEDFSEWAFEHGRVISSSVDFYSSGDVAQELSASREQSETSAAVKAFANVMELAGARRNLRITKSDDAGADLVVSQLVSNDTAGRSARTSVCAEKQLCAYSLVSVTNLNPEQPAVAHLEIDDPVPGAGTATERKISLDVTVPARDSLLLPVHAPLCSAAAPTEKCSDEVIVTGAEWIGAQREGKTLELLFYTPARATLRLRLESAPSKVEFGEDFRAESEWKQESGELEVQLPRGPSPGFERVLRIHLRYTPHVPEKPDSEKDEFHGLDYEFYNSVRYPLGTNITIPTSPPLVVADPNSGGRMIITTRNLSDDLRSVDFTLDGAFRGTGYARVFGNEQQITRLKFQPTHATASPPESLLRGQLTIHSGRERGTIPVLFLTADDAGYSHYQYDFERDGSPDWVLESSRLRLIVSPAYSGRALALVDKETNDDLIAMGDALHDFLIPEGAAPQDAPVSADFSFNRGYQPEWADAKLSTALRLTYREHENSPAGLHVEKTLHFTKPEMVEATYRISYVVPPSIKAGGPGFGMSFLSELTVPVVAGEDGATQFCWQAAISPALPGPPTTATITAPHCEDFKPGGEAVSVPEGITRMVIRSYGRSPLALEWTSGRAIIIPKTFSAQVRFVVPVPRAQEPPGEFTLRYTAGDAP